MAGKTFAAENLLHFQREEPFAFLLRIRCRHATNHAGKQNENGRGESHKPCHPLACLEPLFQDFQLEVPEMDDHIRIVNLELNHAALEALGFWKMLGKFTGKFVINIELEVVALGDDVH